MLPSDFLEKSKVISFEFFRGGGEGVKRDNYSNFFSLYIIPRILKNLSIDPLPLFPPPCGNV